MSGGAGAGTARFRPEIQALRAFAVLIVVVNHLWPASLGGGFVGVDVFFVISGYLITSHLLREVDSTGRIRLASFWARRARRLLPASIFVLIVSAVGVLLFVPMGQWQLSLGQVTASAFYVVNWLLLAQSTDYFLSASSPSPVTHYWSLSVEEQFYVIWPLLILLAFVLARRARKNPRGALLLALGVVIVASLAYSMHVSVTSPSLAYFSTLSRMWEFALGGFLAAVVGERMLPDRMAVWASWVGWIALGLSAIVITETMPFPGPTALLPVLATALVIVAGNRAGAPSLNAVTAFGPIQFLGGISYSLYLWHWPLIILVPYVLGRDIGDLWRMAILVASLVLAWGTKRLVEDPARMSPLLTGRPAWFTLAASAAAMALVVAVTVPPVASIEQRRDHADATLSALAYDPPNCFGARAAVDPSNCVGSHELAYPDALLFTNETQGGSVPGVPESCSTPEGFPEVRQCVFGPEPGDAQRTVAVVGDSHALHYVAALRRLAATDGWRVKMVIRTGCMPIAFDEEIVPLWDAGSAADCRRWSRQAIEHIASDPEVEMVLFSSISREYGLLDGTDPATQDISKSYARTWEPLVDAGKQVLVLADTAFLGRGDVLACIAAADARADACASEAAVVLAKPDPMVVAAESFPPTDVGVFDPNEFICTEDGLCHAIVGGIPVYLDHNHLLQAFAMTLADPLRDAADRLAGQR